MSDPLRFLESLRRQLDAASAAFELSTDAPEPDDRSLAVTLDGGWRVVVRYDAPVDDRAARRQKLMALCAAFPRAVDDAVLTLPLPERVEPPSGSREALDTVLHSLQTLTEAHWAGVIDDSTDELWGSSLPRDAASSDKAVRDAIAAVRALDDREHLLVDDGDDGGLVAHPFGGTYWGVLVFTSAYTELVADGNLVRALPLLETRVAALTPLDDGPGGGKANVVRLR